jgi:hypothetical protein
MTGGEISGNRTSTYGGGVYVFSGTFTKTGGAIYGSDNPALKNVAQNDSSGHAVYVSSSKKRNTTASADVDLDSNSDANWE